jgi:hypothetical protein
MEIVHLSIFTSMDRNAVLLEVREAIAKAGGWIVDQIFFSNVAATINFEISPAKFSKLKDVLLGASLKLHIDSELPLHSTDEIKASISITFSHQEPDMNREVPPFG